MSRSGGADLFDWYPAAEHLVASVQLAFAMLGMGMLLAPEDFREVFRRPRALGIGLALQLVAVPAIAFCFGRILELPIGVVAGLALVASVPGGTLSNVFTYLGGGNIALSISLTASTTVACLAITPLLLRLLLAGHIPADVEMPMERVARDIALALLAPLAVGMVVGARAPALRHRLARWSIRASLVAIAVMVVGGAGAGRLDPAAYGTVAPVAALALAGVLGVAAAAATRLGGLEAGDRLAVVIEVTLRNTNLALLVKASLFPAVAGVADPIGDGMFTMAILYGGLQLIACAVPVALGRRRVARENAGG